MATVSKIEMSESEAERKKRSDKRKPVQEKKESSSRLAMKI